MKSCFHILSILSYFIFFSIISTNAQEKNAEILLKQDICSIENKKLVCKHRLEIAIYNRLAENLTEFSLQYSKMYKIDNLKGFISNSSGQVVKKLNKKDIEDVSFISNTSFYIDNNKKQFILKHNSYPYVIHLSYQTVESDFMFIANWTPIYHNSYETKKAVLEVIVPDDCKINTHEYLVNKPVINHDGTNTQYIWETKFTEIFSDEYFAPPSLVMEPHVKIVPKDFRYGITGNQESWNNLGNWIYNLNSGLQELTAHEKLIIDTLIKNCKSEKEKINKLYDYLQKNTRYVSIILGIGGFKPYPATYVCTNKYGDCKALSNYMRALLKYVGIESFYTIVHSDYQNPPIIRDFPSQQFNHVILLVPIENDSIWLECTSSSSPPGYVGTNIQNRWTLVVDSGRSKLVKTPELSVSDVLSVRKMIIELGIVNSDKININYRMKGRNYEKLNFLKNYLNSNELKEEVMEMVPFNHFNLTDYNFVKSPKDSAFIELDINLETSTLVKQYGNDKFFTLPALEFLDFERPEKRTLPVWINYPINRTDTLTYKIPVNSELDSYPENVELVSEYGKYTLNFFADDKSIKVIRQITLLPGRYKIDDYPEFYTFIQQIKNTERKNIITLN